MLYTGIDLHKAFSCFATLDEKGKIIKEAKIFNNPTEILNYFWSMNDTHKAVVESTLGWYWLTDLLRKHEIEIVLAHPKMLKAYASAKVKTDKISALVMAQLLRVNFLPVAYQMKPENRNKRDLMRQRLRLIYRRTSMINCIHRLFDDFNVTDPDDLDVLYQLQYQQYDQNVQLLTKQIKAIERETKDLIIDEPDLRRLLWIPGLGKINAFSIFLEVEDIDRFPSEKHFFSYARLVSGASNSGGKTKHNKKAGKSGNRYLKIAFNQAAVHAVRLYPVIRDFYNRKARKKNKYIARTLVAKELARIVYHVWKDRKGYNFTFKGIKIEKPKERWWPRPTSPMSELVHS